MTDNNVEPPLRGKNSTGMCIGKETGKEINLIFLFPPSAHTWLNSRKDPLLDTLMINPHSRLAS